MDNDGTFDLNALKERVDGDMQLLAEILSLSVTRWPEIMTRIERAVAASNSRELEAAAHNIRGDFVNLHATRASNTALALEIKGRNHDCADTEDIYTNLVREVGILTPRIVSLLQNNIQQY